MKEHLIFLARRAAALLIVLFLIASLFFSIFFVLPPSKSEVPIPIQHRDSFAETIAEDLKLGEPIYVQYANYMVKVFTGKFFVSMSVKKGVLAGDFIFKPLGWTMLLVAFAAYGLAIIAAARRALSKNPVLKRISPAWRGVELLFFSLPTFALAMAILLIFAGPLHSSLIPIWGHQSYDIATMDLCEKIVDILIHAALPATTIGLSAFGCFFLLMRDSRRLSSSLDYIAEKHLGEALPDDLSNLRTRTVLVTGLFFVPWLVFLTMPADIVFNYGGLGSLLRDSLYEHDLTVLLSTTVLTSMLCALLQFFVHLSYPLWAWTLQGRQPSLATYVSPDNDSVEVGSNRHESTASSTAMNLIFRFWRRRRGVLALSVLVAMAIVALLAPTLSPVGDPMDYENFEPDRRYDAWLNPLEPSLKKSPYTGFVHPLGTDTVGRDILGLMLYGTGKELVALTAMILICFFVALLTGLIADFVRHASRFTGRVMNLAFSLVAYALLAIPLLVLVAGPALWNESQVWILIAVWAWAPAALVTRESIKAERAERLSLGLQHRLERVLAGALFISKFTGIMAYLSLLGNSILGESTYYHYAASWSNILCYAYEKYAFLTGTWWSILPPLIALLLMIFAMYVVLDTIGRLFEENTAAARSGSPGGDLSTHPLLHGHRISKPDEGR